MGGDEPVNAPTNDLLDEAYNQLKRYFDGALRQFDIELDIRSATSFQRDVLEALRAVPYGATISYGQLAARAGRTGAARAVGQAVGRNPLPVFIPCHRVVSASGGIGGYLGGLAIKEGLLKLEACSSVPGGRPGMQ